MTIYILPPFLNCFWRGIEYISCFCCGVSFLTPFLVEGITKSTFEHWKQCFFWFRKNVPILFFKPLLNGHELQPSGKYGWLSEKVWPSFPGLFSSPRCGGSTESMSSGRLTGSSVASREHLQFHRSPGWCLAQKGSSTGSVSFFSQYFRLEDSAANAGRKNRSSVTSGEVSDDGIYVIQCRDGVYPRPNPENVIKSHWYLTY